MKFDWKQFCDDYSVDYVERGPNVASGHINVACPFCDDPSEHMGLNLNPKTPYWSCWRCRQAGRKPGFLISKILKNRKLTQQAIDDQTENSLDEFDNLFEEKEEKRKVTTLTEKKLPFGVVPLKMDKPTAAPVIEYLWLERGFEREDIKELCKQYDLHYALAGPYAARVLLPVKYEGKLISWTARALWKAKIRYKTEDSGDLKLLVANYDELIEKGGELLCICEGPFDFLKLDFYANRMKDHAVRATCVFGTNYSTAQVNLLAKIMDNFEKAVVIFDEGAELFSMRLREELEALSRKKVFSYTLLDSKDPGDLSPTKVRSTVKLLRRKF